MGPIGGPGAPGAPLRELHLIGFTSDRTRLILAGRRGAKNGGYVVDLDDGLLTEIERLLRLRRPNLRAGQEERPGGERSRVRGLLTPKEMQARLRAGRTIAEVAAEAAVEVDWVERFAAPVLAEQAAAVARAGGLAMRTARRGDSDRPLAASVVRNLADRGIRMTQDELDEAWSALYHADRQWIVRFRYRSRGRVLEAEWLLDSGAGVVTATNKLGLELGFVDPPASASPAGETIGARGGGGSMTPWALGAVQDDQPDALEEPDGGSASTSRGAAAPKRPAAAEVEGRSAVARRAAKVPAKPKAAAERPEKYATAPAENGVGPRARPSRGRAVTPPGATSPEPRT